MEIKRHADEPTESEVEEALAAFGLQAAGDARPKPDMFYLWPCNLRVFNIWHGIQTQWHVGMGGRTGLDYAGVLAYLREVLRIKPREVPQIFSSLQAMEFAALQAWSDKQSG